MSILSQITKFMGPTWGPPGSCRPQMGPMLAPWTLLWWVIPGRRAQTSGFYLLDKKSWLKRKCHWGEIVITDCTGSCCSDKKCSKWHFGLWFYLIAISRIVSKPRTLFTVDFFTVLKFSNNSSVTVRIVLPGEWKLEDDHKTECISSTWV